MASSVGTTYSFKDLSGALESPAIGDPILFGGYNGIDQIVVTNDTQHGSKMVAADGTVMPVFTAGDGGTVQITCQQTSILHKALLVWLNVLKTQASNGDLSNWANSTMLLRNVVDGSSHLIQGLIPNKIPDKSYAAQGQNIVWTLEACSVTSL